MISFFFCSVQLRCIVYLMFEFASIELIASIRRAFLVLSFDRKSIFKVSRGYVDVVWRILYFATHIANMGTIIEKFK